jgi:hypothetical protein
LITNTGDRGKGQHKRSQDDQQPQLHCSVVALKDMAATATGDHTFLPIRPLSYDFICVRFSSFFI